MKSYKSILIIIKNNRKLIKKNIYPNLKKELKSIFENKNTFDFNNF